MNKITAVVVLIIAISVIGTLSKRNTVTHSVIPVISKEGIHLQTAEPKPTPIVVTPAPRSSDKDRCEAQKGVWDAQYKECTGIAEDQCISIGGTFNGCASACRHDPKAQMCTMNCVAVCSF